jgi:hypothetical protein
MKHSLLLLGVVAALTIGAPAYSQYIYMDVNGDGVCTSADALTSSVTGADIWWNTNHNRDGSTAICTVNPAAPLDIFSYGLLLHFAGSGSVTYTGFTNFMDTAHGISVNFTNLDPLRTAGADMSISYAAPPGVKVAPGLYRIGRVSITVSGTPVMTFAILPADPAFVPFTGFGSTCDGSAFGSTVALGYDYNDACGTAPGTPTESTTWGKIKQLYR